MNAQDAFDRAYLHALNLLAVPCEHPEGPLCPSCRGTGTYIPDLTDLNFVYAILCGCLGYMHQRSAAGVYQDVDHMIQLCVDLVRNASDAFLTKFGTDEVVRSKLEALLQRKHVPTPERGPDSSDNNALTPEELAALLNP
jgi:hypothetical protein